MDLALWGEFAHGLSEMLGVPLSLYDASGGLISSPSLDNPVCASAMSTPPGRRTCAEVRAQAVSEAVEKQSLYVLKCHANQYIFAVPVVIDHNRTLVVIGGHVYLSGDEAAQFAEGARAMGLDDDAASGLMDRIKTIPPNSLFTIPAIVRNMAAPFLKGICLPQPQGTARSAARANGRDRLKGFYALERVYRSLAPLLEREELYETILEKSSELVGAEKGSLMILDEKDNVLSVKACKGIEPELRDRVRVRIGEGISGAIAAKGLPVMVEDIETEDPSRRNRPRYRTKSFISVPLKLEGRVIGVINVSDKVSGEIFSEEDLQLLLSFASYASIALERGAYYSLSEELKTLSMTDPLTGLFNRRYFLERIFEEVERVKRHSECFTVFILDVDDFKAFNDTYGHVAGDELLKAISRVIRDAVRSMDVVARIGGEEFAVILPHTSKTDSHDIAERIRSDVEACRPDMGRFKRSATVSLGIAEFPSDADNIDDLIEKADAAMYKAKRSGKNKVVLYE